MVLGPVFFLPINIFYIHIYFHVFTSMYMYVYINLSRHMSVFNPLKKPSIKTLAATKPQAQIFMTPDDFNLNLGTTST